jgi:hypothetical protein
MFAGCESALMLLLLLLTFKLKQFTHEPERSPPG